MLRTPPWTAFRSPAWVLIERFEFDTSATILISSLICMPWDGSRPMPSPCILNDLWVRRGTFTQPWRRYVRGDKRVILPPRFLTFISLLDSCSYESDVSK